MPLLATSFVDRAQDDAQPKELFCFPPVLPWRQSMLEFGMSRNPMFQAMLTKTELLNKVRELADASKSDVVRACGYVSTTKDGRERLNFTAFYEAVLDAKGVEIGGGGGSKSGRKLSFMTKIQGNGNLLIGKAYTKKLGLNPGDEFEIKLGRKNIRLVPLGSEDDGGEE